MKPAKIAMVIVFLLGSLANPILADEESTRVPEGQKSGIVNALTGCVNKGLEIGTLFWKKAHKKDPSSMTTSSLAQPGSYSLTPPRNAEPNKETLKGLLRETCDSKE